MQWQDDRAAAMGRGLGAQDRRVLEEAIRQAMRAVESGRRDALEHGLWINVRPDPIDFRDRIYEPGLIALAPRRDPPAEFAEIVVRDQGYLSSCTGMALATAVDFLRWRQWTLAGRPGEPPPPVSARMLYEMGRAYDEHPDDDLPGSSVRGVLRGFFHNGVCREIEREDDPLKVGPRDWDFTIERAKDARHVTLGLYARLQHVLLDYHCALNDVGVVLVSTKLHEGWRLGGTLDDPDAEQRWRIRWDGSQKMLGGHAVVLVGYDETGFLVRNSWGERWSRWQDAHAGVAHWSYDDWQQNVMDAWVIRLAVAGSHGARAVGGGFAIPGVPAAPSRGSPPRILVNGHYLHAKDGRLVRSGTYNCNQRSVVQTAELLRTTADYDHVVIAVESGLDDLETMVQRAVLLIPHLKRARIYPLFVWWRDGCFEFASELLEDRARRLEPRTGGVAQLGARLLEAFAREFMQPFWRTFEGEAERAFTLGDPRRGEAWTALRTLLAATRDRASPLQVHAVAHGSGAVWLGELCRRLADPGTAGAGWPGPAGLEGLFRTVSLLAPVCQPELFTAPAVGRLWAGDRQPRAAIYTLAEQDDEDDRVGAFQGSFLHLARRAFPIGGSLPGGIEGPSVVLGHAQVARRAARRPDMRWLPVSGRVVGASCRTHRGLVADVDVLQHVLVRILVGPEAAARDLSLALPHLG